MHPTPSTSFETGHRRALPPESEPQSPPPAVDFSELVVLTARICGTPISLITLLERDGPCCKAQHGLAAADVPLAVAFGAQVSAGATDGGALGTDAAGEARRPGGPAAPRFRFCAGVTLHTAEGHPAGTLCVLDLVPRTLTPDQTAALAALGRQVVAQLELHRSLAAALRHHWRLANSQRIAGLGDWEYDFANHGLTWSDEVYRILGLAREACPPDSETFYRRVHPDDLAFVQQEKQVAATGLRRVDFEHRIIRPDGEVRFLRQVAELLFDEAGNPVREAGTIQDITERKLAEAALRDSEARFKFVVRAMSDVVWDWDLRTGTVWWNDGFLTTFGFGAGEVLPSIEFWTGRIHAEDRARVTDGIHRALDTGAEKWSAEYRFQRKDGSYALVGDRGYILRDGAGAGVRMVGGMRDLTEQRAREAQHLRAQRLESIGTLAGGIAHDLNNVLAPIMMSIELLKLDSSTEAERLHILETIHASSRRGADLVRQVLTFARGLDGQRVTIRLRALIVDLAGIISQTFPRNIRIATLAPATLWPITGDPTQIHQVLLNLAVNARDAMPLGGTLTLTAANVLCAAEPAGDAPPAGARPYVLLQVADTGEGIPVAVRERMFEPFFTTKEIGKGTGLGLAIVHTVVKSHGGFLRLESEVGQGTTFSLWLPAEPALRPAESAPVAPAQLPHGHAELVLVVDDDEAIRDITGQTLEVFGYRVLTAQNGAEAVALYTGQSRQIAVVLTDMMMPVMDGPTAMRELKRINPAVKIIAVSGLNSIANVDPETRAGFPDFLPKPFTAEALLRLVREVIDRAPAVAAGA